MKTNAEPQTETETETETVDTDNTTETVEAKRPDKAQYSIPVFLLLLAALAAFDASRTGTYIAGNDVIGPKALPYLLAAGLTITAVLYAIDIRRGGRGDDAIEEQLDWKTITLLCAVFGANVLLVDWLGWVISGGMLYFGTAIVLGTRRYIIAALVALTLSLSTFYGFAIGLGIGLPAGILQGIL